MKTNRRNKKNCRFFSQEHSKTGYCMNAKAGWLFCDGVCQFTKTLKGKGVTNDHTGSRRVVETFDQEV